MERRERTERSKSADECQCVAMQFNDHVSFVMISENVRGVFKQECEQRNIIISDAISDSITNFIYCALVSRKANEEMSRAMAYSSED